MQYLYKLFYQHSQADFIKLFEERLAMETSVKTNFKIKPINQPNNYNLYYVPTNYLIKQVSEIYYFSQKLNEVYNLLPPVSQNQFVLECIVEEIFNSNELEGVKSSRREIVESVKSVKVNNHNKMRFNSLIKLYFKLINRETRLPNNHRDIRLLYDEITEGEIQADDRPDGLVFRKDTTYVLAKSGTGKVIHQGITPEDKIIARVNDLLDFLKEKDDIPELVKVAIGHYYFGYIHPFYDGNGRTSRFISTLFLAEQLGEVSALSLSRACNKFKDDYLESFAKTNNFANSGELNYFIDTFFKIIKVTLQDMYQELKMKEQLIKMAWTRIEEDKELEDDNERNCLFVLAQNYFFDFGSGMTIKELTAEVKLSETTSRKIVNKLRDKSFITQTGIRPAYYNLAERYLNE